MVRRFIFLFILSCSSFALAQAQAPVQTLSAFVDRTDITLNDVFTLTIRVDAEVGGAAPSFSGLNRDFEQLGIARGNTYSNVNGDIQSWDEYSISLKPKSTGALTIPAFRVGGQVTIPITVNVDDAPQTAASESSEIFIDTSVSKTDIYVQEQLLYTIKLYYTIGFDQGAQLTSPQVTNALTQQLGSDETFQEIIDGLRYNVTERKFMIFPQSSGELTIPPINFTATLGRRGGLSRILSNRANVREVNLSSNSHVINVMGKPASFTNTNWLPSSNFSIEESWSGALDNITVGESITRNLVITAAGLSSSLIPEISYDDITNLKFYPDQAVREDLADITGITGKRSEGTAIVPSAVGDYALPAIEIPWWNTVTDSLEIATIPARTLSVVQGSAIFTEPQAQLSLGSATNSIGFAGDTTTPFSSNQSSPFSLYWIIATALFASAWLFSTTMWLRYRRMLEQVGTADFVPLMPSSASYKAREIGLSTPTEEQSLPDLNTAYRVFKRSCEQSNPLYIKRSLITWAQAFYQSHQIITLDNLLKAAQSPELDANLANLEKSLYSEDDSTEEFSGKALLNEVSRIHKSGNKKSGSKADHSLPPLYKN